MRFHKLDLNLLVALDALLTDRNITRASERVHLSQSAMSNALGRLRDYFEDELLVQIGRQMELTPRAQVLQDAVRDVLVRIDTSIAAQPEFDCTKSDREFAIFVSDFSMDMLMPHALAIAAKQRSTVRFKFLPQIAKPARALERGEADLLIIPSAYCSAEHPTDILFVEEFVCVVWRESTHARAGMSFDRYAGASHVVMMPVDSPHMSFEAWFVQRYGLSRRVGVQCYNLGSMPHLVVGTELVATTQGRLARRLLPSLPLVLQPVPLPMAGMEQAMQWHKYRTSDPGLVWLRKLMQAAAAAMTADPSLQVPSVNPDQLTSGQP